MGCQGADAGVWGSVEVSVRGWEGKYEEADSTKAGKTANNIQLLSQEGSVAAEAKSTSGMMLSGTARGKEHPREASPILTDPDIQAALRLALPQLFL